MRLTESLSLRPSFQQVVCGLCSLHFSRAQSLLLSQARIDGLTIKYRKYTLDKLIIRETIVEDDYQFEHFGLESTSTVIDVGAHIGCFTIKVANIVKDGRIFSFELQADNYRILTRNVKLNRLGVEGQFEINIGSV